MVDVDQAPTAGSPLRYDTQAHTGFFMLFEIKSSEITVDTQEQKKILAADTRRQTQTLPTGLSALRVSCPSGKGQGLPWAGHGQRQMGRAGPVSFTRNSSKHFRVKTPPFFATGPHERTQTGTSNRTAGRPIKCWIPQNSHHTERVKCASFTQKCSKQFWVNKSKEIGTGKLYF